MKGQTTNEAFELHSEVMNSLYTAERKKTTFTFSFPVTLTLNLLTSNLFFQLLVFRVRLRSSPPNLKFLRLSAFETIVGTGQTDGRTDECNALCSP